MANAIVVVGAGVSGLTSALLLSKDKSKAVTIVAKHVPGDCDIEYASPWAGACFLPMASPEDRKLEQRTWIEMNRLASEIPEAGIHFQKSKVLRRSKDSKDRLLGGLFAQDPWFKSLMPDYRELNPNELLAGYESGCQCLKQGVIIKRAVLSHLSEANTMSHTGRAAHVVVNATGLGSLKLGGVADAAMAPARGQSILVRNRCPFMLCTPSINDDDTEMLYLMERACGGGTVLGGSYHLGDWTAEPDLGLAARIAARAVEAYPALAGGRGVEGLDVVRHIVGLRPYRKGGVRIQAERFEHGLFVVHNYGHAGWGYLASYGCAERVVELVNQVLADKEKQ